MSIEKAKVDEAIYDVLTHEEYYSMRQGVLPQFTAIKEEEYLYPIRSKTDTRPGAYPSGPVIFYKDPETDEQRNEYSVSNIINFSDSKNLKELIQKQNAVRNTERAILTTIDNIFVPEIGENDTPAMKGLKEAIIAKKVDIDKYESRFGANYNNDKRLLRRDSITLQKMESLMGILDMKGTLIIEDADPNVPNPIGRQIIVELDSKRNEGG